MSAAAAFVSLLFAASLSVGHGCMYDEFLNLLCFYIIFCAIFVFTLPGHIDCVQGHVRPIGLALLLHRLVSHAPYTGVPILSMEMVVFFA